MSADILISLALNGLSRSPAAGVLVVFGASYLPWLMGLAALAWLWQLRAPEEEKLRLLAAGCLAMLLSRGIVTTAFNLLLYRPRPFLALPGITPLFTVDLSSFPSGHAATLFAFATVVFQRDRRMGTALLLLSAAVAICRVIAGVHYLSDIIAGAIIGTAAALAASAIMMAIVRR